MKKERKNDIIGGAIILGIIGTFLFGIPLLRWVPQLGLLSLPLGAIAGALLGALAGPVVTRWLFIETCPTDTTTEERPKKTESSRAEDDGLGEYWYSRLNAEDPHVVWGAIDNLAIKRSRKAVLPLIETMKKFRNKNTWLYCKAAQALRLIGDERAIPSLIDMVDQRASDARDNAWLYLIDFGDKAVEPLIQVLQKQGSPATKELAARVLGEIGDARAVEPLIQTLSGREAGRSLRWEVARALGKLGDPRAVEHLKKMQEDDDPNLRDAVAEALSKLGVTEDIEYGSLHAAIAAGDESAVEKLLTRGANVNETSGRLDTPALICAINGGKVRLVKLLLEKGADPNMPESSVRMSSGRSMGGNSPLHAAVICRDREIVELLLAHGANPLMKRGSGDMPIDIAEEDHIIALLEKAEDIATDKQDEKLQREKPDRESFLNDVRDKVQQALLELPLSEEGVLRAKIKEIAETWGVGIIDGDLATVKEKLMMCFEQDMEGQSSVWFNVRADTDRWGDDAHNAFFQMGRGMHHVGRYEEGAYLAVLHARF